MMPLMSEMMSEEAPRYESRDVATDDVFVDEETGETYGFGDLPY